MGFLLRGIIKGELVHNHATSNVVVHGQISASRLVDQVTTYVVDNFVTAFANFYEELVMSLISEPYLEIANELTVVCKRSRWESRFK